MNGNGLERSYTIAQWLKAALALSLPTLLLVLLLFGLGQGAQAEPNRQQGENLVLNPGFEYPSPAHWSNPGSSQWFWWYFWSGSVSHGGDHSVGIGSNVSEYRGQWWSDFFAVEAGQQYDFSGWIRPVGLPGRAFITLAFYSSPSQEDLIEEFRSSQVTGLSDWREVTGSAVAPDGAQYARVYCELIDRGTVWFDDIFVGEATTGKPIIAINKSDQPDPVVPGQSLVYTIRYSNTGNISATQVIITETYDVNVTFDSAHPAPKLDSDDRVWEIRPLGPQSQGTITITVTVNSPLTDDLTLLNQVEMDCDETDLVSDTVTTKVTNRPDLGISKSGNPDPVEPGGTLVYTITYNNTGTAVATGARITDTLPVSVSYESASVTPTIFASATNTLVWENLDDLGVGADRTIVVTTAVSSSAHRGDSLCNQVWIGCDRCIIREANENTTIRPLLISIAPGRASRIVLPGQEACYAHTIYLTRTQPHTISIVAVSSHSWATNTTPSSVYLEPGNSKQITACVGVPASSAAVSGTVDTLSVTASLVVSPGETVVASDSTVVGRVLPGIPVIPVSYSVANCSGQYPQGFALTHSVAHTGNYTDEFEVEVVADCCPDGCPPEMVQVVPSSQIVGVDDSFTATVYITVTTDDPKCWAKIKITSGFPHTPTVFVDEVKLRRVGLKVSPDTTTTAYIFSTVTQSHLITNEGNCVDTFGVTFTSAAPWTVTVSPPTVTLASYLTDTILTTVTVPPVRNSTVNTVVITATSDLEPTKQGMIVERIVAKADEMYLPLVLKMYPPSWHQGTLQHLVKTVAACFASPKDFVYAGHKGVYISTTGGETWIEAGLDNLTIRGLAVHTNCQISYAATYGDGIFKRTSTAPWSKQNAGLGNCLHSRAIAMHPTSDSRLCVGTASHPYSTNSGVFVSTDGANNWTRTLGDKDVASLSIAASAPYTIHVGTTVGMFRSMDGGYTWSPMPELPKDSPGQRIQINAIIETPGGQVYAGHWEYVHRMGKGLWLLEGNQWKSVPIDGHTDFIVFGLVYVEDSLYVATHHNGVYRFKNDAWELLDIGLDDTPPEIYSMSSTQQRLYIATSSGVWWYPLPQHTHSPIHLIKSQKTQYCKSHPVKSSLHAPNLSGTKWLQKSQNCPSSGDRAAY